MEGHRGGRRPGLALRPRADRQQRQDRREERDPARPNNPVGNTWIGISKEHYGIHGTPSPAKIGKTESSGCIRMTNWSAAALAKVVTRDLVVSLRE